MMLVRDGGGSEIQMVRLVVHGRDESTGDSEQDP